MKRIAIMIFGLMITLMAFGMPPNSNVSTSINQTVINNFFKVLCPIAGTKQIQIFTSTESMSYNLSNIQVSVVNGAMPFTANIMIKSPQITENAAISGQISVSIDKTTNSLQLNLSNFNSSNPTMLSLLTTLAAVGAFNISYPIKANEQTYDMSQFGKTQPLSSKFILENISLVTGQVIVSGNIVFQ